MKSTDKPELSKKWWTKEKPVEIKGNDLEKALAACESALADAKKKEDADTVETALKSLEGLSDAVDETCKEGAKKKLRDVVTVLEKFEKLIDEKTKDLQRTLESLSKDSNSDEKREDSEDEDAKTVFKPEYLMRMIKQLRGGEELRFSMGLDKHSPENSRLVLCNKRQPERLFKMLKQTGDFTNRLMTFGTVTGDGKILDLKLSDNAKEPSQIVKTAKGFFKNHKDLKYRKIRVHAGGEVFEEEMAELEAGAGPDAATTGGATMEDLRRQFKIARKKWVTVRDKAEQDLEIVKDGVRDHYLDDVEQFPIAVNKLRELDEIMDNLNDDLRNAVDEYVSTPLSQQEKLHELGTHARGLVDTFADYVEQSQLLDAIDQREFADVQIKAPMSAALRELAKTIA